MLAQDKVCIIKYILCLNISKNIGMIHIPVIATTHEINIVIEHFSSIPINIYYHMDSNVFQLQFSVMDLVLYMFTHILDLSAGD